MARLLARELLPPQFQGGVGEGEGKLQIHRHPDDLRLEGGRAAHGDARAKACQRQAQRDLDALARSLVRHLEAVAIVAHRRGAGAIEDRALLGDGVAHERVVTEGIRNGTRAGPTPTPARDGVALQAPGGLARAQRRERLGVAVQRLVL